ncbi:MAG TPA: cytochrome c3 family protein, partial [Gemmatimonadales bacterium]
MRRFLGQLPIVIGAAIALASAPVAAPAQTTESSPPATAAAHATYVGANACADCHEDQVKGWEHNPHHGSQTDANPAGKEVGCESCHGPGSLHVEAAGDKDNPGFHTIRVLTEMKPNDAADVCATCHRTSEQFHWPSSKHAQNGVTCIDCHSVHAPKDPGGQMLLKQRTATEQCVACHHDKRAELAHTAHMPVREGGMTCADCHNPHGSPGPHMVRGVSNNELCESCHMDKRGP